jgi:hypothetical protein
VTPRLCIVCGAAGRLQLHHLAGRAYAMRLVAWTCPRCHRYLHGRLAAGGIDLRHPTLSPAVGAWAVTRGVSETIAAALVILDQDDSAAALRLQARRVGRLLVATSPVCEALSPRPLAGRRCPSPAVPVEGLDRAEHAATVMAVAHAAAHHFDAEKAR